MYWRFTKIFLITIILQLVVIMLAAWLGGVAIIIGFWVSIVNMTILSVMVGILYFYAVEGNWGNLIDTSVVDIEQVDIPMKDDWKMAALLIKRRDAGEQDGGRPAIICHHGLGSSSKKHLKFAIPLAMMGMVAILPDARGHGASVGRIKARKDDWYITESTGIIPDLHAIVDFVEKRDDINPGKISMMGASLGGGVCLTSGMMDDRLNLVIAVNPYFSIKEMMEARRAKIPFTEPWFMKTGLRFMVNFRKLKKVEERISPKHVLASTTRDKAERKMRLVFCEDDHLVLPEVGAKRMIDVFQLPDRCVLSLKKGDHNYRGQETIVLTRIVQWLEEAGMLP
ncbi:alpha/beta fold hydrolase [Candidatus Bathyarchaeota archaeon]|nr:alpha/beta fold hydrolase [Candidatus Bathyarchaeota archaeon]